MKKFLMTMSICLMVLLGSFVFVACDNSNNGDVTKFTIQLNSSNTEHGTVYGAGNYYEGQTITIVAEAKDGYKFTTWSDGSTEAIRTITIDSDEKLTANFESERKSIVHSIGSSVSVSLNGTTNEEDVLYVGVKKLEFVDNNVCFKYVDASNYAPEMPLVYMDLSGFNDVGSISNYQTVELVNQSNMPFIGPNAFIDEISFKVRLELVAVNHQGQNMVEHFINEEISITIDTSDCSSVGSRGFSLNLFEDELWEGTSIYLTFDIETNEV